MPKRRKPYEGPLEGGLADDILNIPFDSADGSRTLRERVASVLDAIEKAEAELAGINSYLSESPMAAIVARTLMQQLKRRGDPSIRVKADGSVILYVAYDTDSRRAPPPPIKKRAGGSDLPRLDELKAQADALGVGYEDLGRQRRALFERIQTARGAKALTSSSYDQRPPERLVDEITTVKTGDDGGRKVTRRRKIVRVDPGNGGAALVNTEDEQGAVAVDDFLERFDTEEAAKSVE